MSVVFIIVYTFSCLYLYTVLQFYKLLQPNKHSHENDNKLLSDVINKALWLYYNLLWIHL